MILDHCHRASCVQIIDQLRTTITEKDARIAQLEEALKFCKDAIKLLQCNTDDYYDSAREASAKGDKAINKINEVIGS